MKKSNSTRVVYLNPAQKRLLRAKTAFRVLIAGRGTGKGVCIGWSIADKVSNLPGGKGMLTCNTLKQLKNKTIPGMKKVWRVNGWNEGQHYWAFKKPPQSVIDKIIAAPTDWSDVISFANGTHLECVSAKQYDNAAGGSYDFIELDEACFFPELFFNQIVLPSLRGNIEYFKGRWQWQQVSIYSSMARKLEGMWVVTKFEELAEKDPVNYYYTEATTMENIHVFGRKKLEQLKKTMSYLTYQVEFFNMRIHRAEIPYYYNYSEEKHLYSYTEKRAGRVYDANYKADEPLDLVFDFGGWYSPMGVIQSRNSVAYMINHFDAKKDEGLKDLCTQFDKVYNRHRNKTLYLYGDPRGHNLNEIMPTSPYKEVQRLLKMLGWTVIVKVPNYKAEDHQYRYQKMNDILSESAELGYPALRINSDTCSDVNIAMHLTESTDDFRKNKKTEKDKKFPQQHAPHNTDLVDYYFMQKFGWIFKANRKMSHWAG